MSATTSFRRAALTLAVLVSAAATTVRAGDVPLGAAATFAVLGGSTVTNTGPTIVTGDVGVSPGPSIVFGAGTVQQGSLHANDALAAQAHASAATAYGTLFDMPSPAANNKSNVDLGGITLTPGVYKFDTAAELTGTLTLDGNSQLNPLFVFQIGTTLTTASASAVLLINGATADNLYFQVGTSSTFGIGTAFAGTVIASASNTLTTGVSLNGRVLALNGAVTLDSNAISVTSSAVPEPSALLLATPLLLLATARRRRRA